MKRFICSLLIPFFSSLFLQNLSAQSISKSDWVQTLDSVAIHLPQRHKNLYFNMDSVYFRNGIERIKAGLNDESDMNISVILKLQQLIASMGDSHTSISIMKYLDQTNVLPLGLYDFKDGVFVMTTTKANEILTGKQLVAINDIPVDEVKDRIGSLIGDDNAGMRKIALSQFILFKQLTDFLEITDSSAVIVSYKEKDGTISKHQMILESFKKENISQVAYTKLMPALRHQKSLFADYLLSDSSVYVLQYNRCWNRELEEQYGNQELAKNYPSFEEWKRKVYTNLDSLNVDKIVFDVRFNGGGNSLPGKTLIDGFSKYVSKNPELKFYVVLGRNTFSSGILNALNFKQYENVVFVGESTAGSPNHYGEVRSFKALPLGIEINYSTKYFKHTDDPANTFNPDIQLESTFEEWISGKDPILDWIQAQ
ncbi:MAG: hypothetical protein ACRCX5_13655 [Bacteroidales bacterium]